MSFLLFCCVFSSLRLQTSSSSSSSLVLNHDPPSLPFEGCVARVGGVEGSLGRGGSGATLQWQGWEWWGWDGREVVCEEVDFLSVQDEACSRCGVGVGWMDGWMDGRVTTVQRRCFCTHKGRYLAGLAACFGRWLVGVYVGLWNAQGREGGRVGWRREERFSGCGGGGGGRKLCVVGRGGAGAKKNTGDCLKSRPGVGTKEEKCKKNGINKKKKK